MPVNRTGKEAHFLDKRVRTELIDWSRILAGLMLSAMGYQLFLIPNEVAPGGFTGIGQILNTLFGWNVGFVALALNVPLFMLSMRSMGWRFGIRSLLASAAFSMLVDYLPFGALTHDRILAAIFGGVVAGAGFGLIMLGDATTGGSDMLGMLIHRKVKVVKISALVFSVDALVIVAAGVVYDVQGALLALISTYVMARVLDRVLEGPNMAKAYFIISRKADEIASAILKTMDRGRDQPGGEGHVHRRGPVGAALRDQPARDAAPEDPGQRDRPLRLHDRHRRARGAGGGLPAALGAENPLRKFKS